MRPLRGSSLVLPNGATRRVTDIRERLAREGMEPPGDAPNEFLAKLAGDGDIMLASDDRGATVYRNPRSKLCGGQAGE